MTTLSALKTILQSEVPAVDGVPTSTQYEQAIKDAVADFSRRCGRVKLAELSIVSGTATYSLAADFLDLIWLEAMVGLDGVLISDTGLIPVSADWNEEYYISNGQITFVPTPAYTVTRDYKYKAAWVLTGGTDYATLGSREQDIVLMKAKQICLEKIKNGLAASGGMKYSFGAVSVDKSSGVEELSRQMFALHGEYAQACKDYNGSASTAW